MAMNPDLYQILKIKWNASQATIKKAYRKRSMETHTDRGGDKEEFQLVHLAYKILSDPPKKKHYDETGQYDKLGPNNELSQVMMVISQIFSAVMQNLMQNNRNPLEEDIAGLMKKCFADTKNGLAQTVKQITTAKDQLKGMLGRFSTENGEENVMESMIVSQLGIVENELLGVKGKIELTEKAEKVFKKFKYRFDPKQMVGMFTRVSWGGFSSATGG